MATKESPVRCGWRLWIYIFWICRGGEASSLHEEKNPLYWINRFYGAALHTGPGTESMKLHNHTDRNPTGTKLRVKQRERELCQLHQYEWVKSNRQWGPHSDPRSPHSSVTATWPFIYTVWQHAGGLLWPLTLCQVSCASWRGVLTWAEARRGWLTSSDSAKGQVWSLSRGEGRAACERTPAWTLCWSVAQTSATGLKWWSLFLSRTTEKNRQRMLTKHSFLVYFIRSPCFD